jgi:hypothetical protein
MEFIYSDRAPTASFYARWFGVLAFAAVVVSAGCSAGQARVDAGGSDRGAETGPAGDDQLFVPEGLPNINQDGQESLRVPN